MQAPAPHRDPRWKRQQELFAQARLLAAEAREAWLAAACGDDLGLRLEVLSLIAAEERAGAFLEAPLARLLAAPEEDEDELLAGGGADIGPWRLLSRLGRGGMGTVYRAVRADDAYHQQVAVKVLRRGLDTADLVSRFRRERQILAQLEHPAIARLLDGGATPDGRPYLVMEQVEGLPIDRYCEQHGLDVEARVRLFRRVVAAVSFAHQNLVVHRDLKPANILVVAGGEPKLLDFGVAKLLAEDEGAEGQGAASTVVGPAPYTPRYASPEQQSGAAITTASDVYSLGVVLRELLSGIAGSRLGRDLAAITARALEAERERRYPSAEALGEDLERCLSGHPLAARGGHFAERASKFVRRHRLALAAASLLLAALFGFLITLLIQRRQVLAERGRAETVSGFLVELFALPDPTRARGETVTARELLDRGVAALASAPLEGQAAAEAELAATMGRSYRNLGLLREAEPLLDRSLELARRAHGQAHPRVAAALQERADLAAAAGDYGLAESLSREALEFRRALHGEAHPEITASLTRLARAQALAGQLEAAEASYDEALGQARRRGEAGALATVLQRYAGLLARKGRGDEAEAMVREALGLLSGLHGHTHPEVALAGNDLALLVRGRDAGAALELLDQALEQQRRLYTEPHPDLASTLHNRGLLLSDLGRYDAAAAAFEEALSIERQVYRGDHPRLAKTLTLLARLRFEQGGFAAAETLDREALEMAEKLLDPNHLDLAEIRGSLGRTLAARGEHQQAQGLFEAALASYRRELGGEAEPVGAMLNNLADLAQSRGERAMAEGLYRDALVVLRRIGAPAQGQLATVLHNLASVERSRGDLPTSEAHLGEALALTLERRGPAHPEVARMRVSLASLLLEAGRVGEAQELARQALAVLEPLVGPSDPWLLAARRALRARKGDRTPNRTRPAS